MTDEHKALVARLLDCPDDIDRAAADAIEALAALVDEHRGANAMLLGKVESLAAELDEALLLLRYSRQDFAKVAARAEAAEAKLYAAQEELRRLKWHPEKANP